VFSRKTLDNFFYISSRIKLISAILDDSAIKFAKRKQKQETKKKNSLFHPEYVADDNLSLVKVF